MNGGKSYNDRASDVSAAISPCSILLQQYTGSVEIYGISRSVIIDTGCNVSMQRPAVLSRGVIIT